MSEALAEDYPERMMTMSYIKYLKRVNQRAERKIDSLKKMIDLLRVEREQLKEDCRSQKHERDLLLEERRTGSWLRNAEIGCDPEWDEGSKENARQFELSSLRVQNSALLARLQEAGVLKPGEQVGLYPPLTEEAKVLFGRLLEVLASVTGLPEGYEENGIPLSAVVERTERKLPVIKDESNTANKLWNLILIITGSPMDTPYGPEEVAKIEDLIPEWKAKLSSLPVKEDSACSKVDKINFERITKAALGVVGLPNKRDDFSTPGSRWGDKAEYAFSDIVEHICSELPKLSSLPVKEDKESETKLSLANDLWDFLVGLEPVQSKDTPLDEGNLEMMKSELAHHKKGFERLGKLWKFLLKSFWFPVIYPVTDCNIEELKERITRTLSSLSEAKKSSVNGEEEIPPLVVYPDKEGHGKRGQFIASVLYETGAIAKMLIEKNQSYGNSALDPIRLFSKSDAREQIRVRIDDKLSRIQRGKEYPGDNDVNDLIGYLFLYKISLATD